MDPPFLSAAVLTTSLPHGSDNGHLLQREASCVCSGKHSASHLGAFWGSMHPSSQNTDPSPSLQH